MYYTYVVRRHWIIRWLFVLSGIGEWKIVTSKTPPAKTSYKQFRYVGEVEPQVR